MTSTVLPCRESIGTTLLRTIAIAVAVGLILSLRRGDVARWPILALLVLWPSFGGHWVEIAFLNWVRPRISSARAVQIAVRLAVWFVGGCVLALGVNLTARALGGFMPVAWWIGGLGFIGLELVVHLILQLRRLPSFYNGRG